jgi:hypothetical protein
MARGQKSQIDFSRRYHLVSRGKASRMPYHLTVKQAIEKAGL